MLTRVLALLALTCSVAPAIAADDGKEILRQAGQAIASARTLQFTATREGAGEMSVRSPRVAGSVEITAYSHDKPQEWRFAIRGDTTPSNSVESHRFETVCDGDKAIMIRHEEKKVLEGTPAQVRDMLAEGGGMLASFLLNWQTLVDKPVIKTGDATAKVIGARVVGGVPCDVVQVDYSGTEHPEYLVWFSIGREDHFPRRVEALYTEQSAGMGILTITDLRVNAELDPGMLKWTLPTDYQAGPYVPKMTAPSARPTQARAPKVGEPMPEWSFKDLEGKALSSKDLLGSVYLLDFWATWCPPCRAAMPGVQAMHDRFKDKPVRIIGANCWESGDPRKFVKQEGFTYTFLLETDDLSKALGVSGIPAFFVVGADGRIVHSGVGYSAEGEKQVERAIEAALKQVKP